MSDIIRGFRTYLVSKTAVTDEVSTRIYPGVLPQGATLPAGVITVVTQDTARHLTAQATNTDALVQIDWFAETWIACEAAADGARDAANGYTGSAGDETIRSCYLESERAGIEPPKNASDIHRHRITQEWRIHLAETAASL